MRTQLAPLAFAVTAAVSLSACVLGDDVPPAPAAFCEAVIDLEDGLERRVGIDRKVRLVRRVAETSPPAIEADAQVFLDAMEAVRADPDDPSLRDDPEVEEAVENVNRYAVDGCELYEREGGGGSPF